MAELSPLLYGDMKAVEVRFSKSPLGNFEEFGVLKFFQVGAHAAFSGSHIGGESLLTWKDRIISPCVFEEHGVCELCANREIFIGEYEIRNLREAMSRDGISSDKLDVAASIFKRRRDVIHRP